MNKRNKIKAAFLLLVFSFNTIAGFACSVGFDFGQRNNHHEPVKIHVHDKTHSHTSHHHNAEANDAKVAGHSHAAVTPTHADPAEKSKLKSKEDNDCCSDRVIMLHQSDKAIVKTQSYSAPANSNDIFKFNSLSQLTLFNSDAFVKLKPPLLRKRPLANHTALRIVIQSFQI